MNETFDIKQLVKFGQYCLSQERKNRYKSIRINGTPSRVRLTEVTDADIQNFIEDCKETPDKKYTSSRECILR